MTKFRYKDLQGQQRPSCFVGHRPLALFKETIFRVLATRKAQIDTQTHSVMEYGYIWEKMQFISEHMVRERSLWVYKMNMKLRRLRRRTRKCFLSNLRLYIFTYGFKLRCEWPLVCMYWIHKRMHVLCTKYECLASIRTHIIVLTSA